MEDLNNWVFLSPFGILIAPLALGRIQADSNSNVANAVFAIVVQITPIRYSMCVCECVCWWGGGG